MKKAIILTLILSFAISLLIAQAKAPDYKQTLAELSKLEEKGIRNPDLYYNLGVCQAHLGNESQAVLYFLRALNLNSAHREARHNLDYIISLSPDQELYPRQQFIGNLSRSLGQWFNLNRIALFTILLLILAALALHWLLHYPRDKEKGLPVLLTVLAVLLLLGLLTGLISKLYHQRTNPQAVVQAAVTQLYPEANTKVKSLRSLHQNLIVEIEESKGDWCRIKLPNGIEGWVGREDLLRVMP